VRYIDLKKLKVSQNWLDAAQKACEEMKNAATHTERSAVIERHANLWTKLKSSLRALSYNKCWYCESWETRSDTAVDHYRPKNAVREAPSHSGYWWLAFQYSNYRYSCKYCNELRKNTVTGITGGKGTAFPLADEAKRVFNEGPVVSEDPLLLDPIVADDVELITFDPDGTAQPLWQIDEDPDLYKRAAISIILYHLNHPDLKERRQVTVCNEVTLLVEEGDCYFKELDAANQTAEYAFGRVSNKLRRMLAETAEYSAAAKATLRIYRDLPWVEVVLEAA